MSPKKRNVNGRTPRTDSDYSPCASEERAKSRAFYSRICVYLQQDWCGRAVRARHLTPNRSRRCLRFRGCRAAGPLTSPTPPLPWGEEGIKKKISFRSFFLPSLPRGERGRGSEGAGGAATLKTEAAVGSEREAWLAAGGRIAYPTSHVRVAKALKPSVVTPHRERSRMEAPSIEAAAERRDTRNAF